MIFDQYLWQDSLEVAKRVKEMYSYVSPDLAKEFAKYDKQPDKFFKQYQGIRVRRNFYLSLRNNLPESKLFLLHSYLIVETNRVAV